MVILCMQELRFKVRNQWLEKNTPVVMGILNLSPDSFYKQESSLSIDDLVHQTNKMIEEGAYIIDIGPSTSKPGSNLISVELEYTRIKELIPVLKKLFPQTLFSIDTRRSEIAEFALDHGIEIINDISAGMFDDKMFTVCAKYDAPIILMDMPDESVTASQPEESIKRLLLNLKKKSALAFDAGVKDVWIDPGLGFGKTLDENYQILANLSLLKVLDLPIPVGLSRKSMIYKLLEISPEQALNGTTALHMQALKNGAQILRVHDVKDAVECITLYQKLTEQAL